MITSQLLKKRTSQSNDATPVSQSSASYAHSH